MQSIIYTIASVFISIGTITCIAILIRANSNKPLSEKADKLLVKIHYSAITIIIAAMVVSLAALGFMTQGTYNKAIITQTITEKPTGIVIDTNTRIGINYTAKDKFSLTPITDSVEVQQANGNTNFKANILVKYKMVKNEQSILNFYKEYGTTNVKTIVNNEIKSEIAKQSDFAKTGQISEQTFKNIQNGLDNTFEFQSIAVSDFVSSNNQNINLTTNN